MDGENENEGEVSEEEENGSGDTDVNNAADTDADGGRGNPTLSVEAAPEQPSAEMLPVQCSRRLWWDSADSFVFNYIVPPTSSTGNDDQNAAAPGKVQSKIQSSWQLKLLSGSTPLPSALSILMNIILPAQSRASKPRKLARLLRRRWRLLERRGLALFVGGVLPLNWHNSGLCPDSANRRTR